MDICPSLPLISFNVKHQISTKTVSKFSSKKLEFNKNYQLCLTELLINKGINDDTDIKKLLQIKHTAYSNINNLKDEDKKVASSQAYIMQTIDLLVEYIYHLNQVQERFDLKSRKSDTDVENIKSNLSIFSTPMFAYTRFSEFGQENIDISKDLNFEKTVAMYNYGVLTMLSGQRTIRNTDEECKFVCNSFVTAATIFNEIAENYASHVKLLDTKGEKEDNSNNEISVNSMKTAVNLCLAQAQECCLEKAVKENRKPKILARVAHQIVVFYEQVLEHYESMNEKLGKSEYFTIIINFIKIKVKYYVAIAHVRSAEAEKLNSNFKNFLKHYEIGNEKINECMKLSSKHSFDELNVTIELMQSIINHNYEQSKKDNMSIYFETAAEKVDLPPPASLVKISELRVGLEHLLKIKRELN